jgi:hypothetical protein
MNSILEQHSLVWVTVYLLNLRDLCLFLEQTMLQFDITKPTISSCIPLRGDKVRVFDRHHTNCELKSRSWPGLLDTTICDKVCQWLAAGRWFSPGTPVSSTNKTDRHDIAEILIKVAIYTISLPHPYSFTFLLHPVSPSCLFERTIRTLIDIRMLSELHLENFLQSQIA